MGNRYNTGGLGSGRQPGDSLPEALRGVERRVRNLEARSGVASTAIYPLSTPYIPVAGIVASTEFATPPITVTSASFVDVSHILMYNQHPRLAVYCRLTTDVGTTGEARLSVDFGQSMSDLVSLGSGASFSGHIVVDTDDVGNWGDFVLTVLQARRLSGAGNIRALAVAAAGVDITSGVYP
jgi:hypothetical protein